MRTETRRRAALLALAALCAACAGTPPRPDSAVDAELAACLNLFETQDAQISAAGVRDGGPRGIPGFPYLRVDRFLASFRGDLDTPAQQHDWIEAMRALDLTARGLELGNLHGRPPGADTLAELERCGHELVRRHAPPRIEQLRHAARVPDDYSLAARIFGAYPLAWPFLRLGIAGYRRDVNRLFERPFDPASDDAERVLWTPLRSTPLNYEAAVQLARSAPRDALGAPRPDPQTLEHLFAQYAPAFSVATRDAADYIGAPQAGANGPGVDTDRVEMYTLATHTRWRGEVLLQLVYVVWFDSRPRRGWIDPYAGALDGLIWRVTLDSDGQPLVYDSIHPCGCYHQVFPVKDLPTRSSAGLLRERPLQPQGTTPWWQVAVALQSATHYIERVLPLAAVRDASRVAPMALVSYDRLRSLPVDGGRRSLFASDGLVAGSERGERWWLWPSGVREPGSMRQWGRHATAFVGRAHFDDPHWLDQVFR